MLVGLGELLAGAFVVSGRRKGMSVLEEPAAIGSRLDRLLEGAVTSRLHLALVLVGKMKMDAGTVLDLRWLQVALDRRVITTRDGRVGFGEPIAGLLYWHATRQRMDHMHSRRWADAGMVFVNQYGTRFTAEQADAALAQYCLMLDLPVVPLAGLRHPVWAG